LASYAEVIQESVKFENDASFATVAQDFGFGPFAAKKYAVAREDNNEGRTLAKGGDVSLFKVCRKKHNIFNSCLNFNHPIPRSFAIVILPVSKITLPHKAHMFSKLIQLQAVEKCKAAFVS